MRLSSLLKKAQLSMQKITLTTEFVLIHSFFYMTPLHYACKNWFSGAVSFLIEKGADVNAVTQTISFLSECFPHRGPNKSSLALHLGKYINDILSFHHFN